MAFTATKTYSNGSALTKVQLDALWNSIETYFNTTKIASSELSDGAFDSDHLDAISISTAKIVNNAVTLAKISQSLRSQLIITGSITAYASETTPTGFLYCDGSAVSRTTYAGLFAVVGTTFGSGDGSTTFNLPDLRGRFLRGTDGLSTLDSEAASRTAMNSGGNTGDLPGSLQTYGTAAPNTAFTTPSGGTHQHTFSMANSGGLTLSQPAGSVLIWGSTTANSARTLTSSTAETHTHNITSGGDSETRPINANVVYYIKT